MARIYRVDGQYDDSPNGCLFFADAKAARQEAREAASESGVDATVTRCEIRGIDFPSLNHLLAAIANGSGWAREQVVVYVAKAQNRESP